MELQGRILATRRLTNFNLISSVYSPDQILSPHSHEHAYVSVALGGSYEEQCGARSWECETGGSIFHVAGEHHSNRFSPDGARLLILEIAPPLLHQLYEQGLVPDRQNVMVSPYCMHLAFRLVQAIPLGDPLSALCSEGVAMELLAETLRYRWPERVKRSEPDWLGKINAMVHDRYREPVTLSELASSIPVHPVHLARAFRKRYRCSVGDLIRTLRIEAAYDELLHSDAPIADIAARTGFTDQSHLCRMLKRHAGISPGELRKTRPRTNLV